METRILGRTGRPVSVIGLGTWQLGADWGDGHEDDALGVLQAAYDEGVRFFDTADAYGDGAVKSSSAASWQRATTPMCWSAPRPVDG